MASALGSSPLRDRGSRAVDIRDFGARPGGSMSAATANRVAIQAAIDGLGSTALNTLHGGLVYVPAGDWYVDRTIFMDSASVVVGGEGRGVSRVVGVNGSGLDVFMVGLNRDPLGVPLAPNHLVDLFAAGPGGAPLLDASAVSAAGQRWGLRTRADHHLAQQGGTLDCAEADFWGGLRQFTVEFAIDLAHAPGTGGFPASGSLLGMTNLGVSSPWEVYVVNGALRFSFATAEDNGLVDGAKQRYIDFWTVPATPGLARVTIQVDLVNAALQVYVNDTQLSYMNGVGSGFAAGAGLRLAPNQDCPFTLGSNSRYATLIADVYGSAIDVVFAGLKVTKGLIYQDLGPGQPQTRVDNAAITDFKRYFAPEGVNTVGYLPLAEPPAVVAADRISTVQGRYGTSGLYWLPNSLSVVGNAAGSCGFRDLSILGGSPYAGRAVAAMFPLHASIRGCELRGGMHGYGSLNANVNYGLEITGSYLTGRDAPLYLDGTADVSVDHCYLGISTAYRCAVKLFNTAGVSLSHIFTPAAGTPDFLVKGVRSSYTASHWLPDNESPLGGPRLACFYASPRPTYPVGAAVKIDQINSFSQGPESSFVILEDLAPEDGLTHCQASFELDSCSLQNQHIRSFIRTNGPRWHGRFRAVQGLDRPRWVENTGPGGVGNITSEHLHHTGPPRDGAWSAGAHEVSTAAPHSVNTFAEFRCIESGTYGTATPPKWLGVAPLDDGVGLGAYLLDCTYWAADRVGGVGAWSTRAASAFLNGLFRGPVASPPAALWAALGFFKSSRIGLRHPLAGNYSPGYARVALGANPFAASAGGSAANASTIAFPAATAIWAEYGILHWPIGSLALYTAATGGLHVASVDIADRVLSAGGVVSLPGGAIQVARAAASRQGRFAARVHDWLNDYYLRAQSFAKPTIYLALSTAPADDAAPPTEPSGGGYARVASDGTDWTAATNASADVPGAAGSAAIVRNASALAFPAPTAGWGTARSVYLMDAESGGNVLGAANLTVPRTILARESARSFAPGALWICKS